MCLLSAASVLLSVAVRRAACETGRMLLQSPASPLQNQDVGRFSRSFLTPKQRKVWIVSGVTLFVHSMLAQTEVLTNHVKKQPKR